MRVGRRRGREARMSIRRRERRRYAGGFEEEVGGEVKRRGGKVRG